MNNFSANITENLQETKTDGKFLTFYSEEQLFGVPIEQVMQIVGIQEITQIPEMPSFVKGIINLRGDIIPVMDMRLRLSRCEKPYDERTCIIITSLGEKHMGLIVDSVDSVVDIDNSDISDPPIIEGSCNDYLTGIAKLSKSIALLIDLGKILGAGELEMILNNPSFS